MGEPGERVGFQAEETASGPVVGYPVVGYLVPEWPGQTHAFFWREIGELERLGARVEVVSTRRPVRGLRAHAWSGEAEARTTYLWPPGLGGVARMVWGLLRAGTAGWWRVVEVLARCERWTRAARLVPVAAGLASVSRARGWSHVHAHSAGDAAHLAMLCERLGGPAYSVTLHGPVKDYGPNQAEKWRHAKFGIVITQRLLGEMREALAGAMPGRVMVAPMGVDHRRLARKTEYEPWDGKSAVRVFCCARLNRVKGHEELVRAAALLRARGMDVRVTVAGEDDKGGTGYRAELERVIAEMGMAESVELLGAVDEGEVARRLWEAQLFVLASHHEPLGVAIMEAMSAGVPVVVTRGGGVSELVTDGVDGVMAEPRDAEDLARAMERVLRDASLARRLSEAGPVTIERGFSSRVSVEAMLEGIRGAEAAEPVGLVGRAGVA